MTTSYIKDVALQIRAIADTDTEDNELLYLIYAVLALTKGVAVTAADVHHAWSACAEFRREGSIYLVPFEQLALANRRSDEPFVSAIHEVASRLILPQPT